MKISKLKIILLFTLLIGLFQWANAQVLYNNGATIHMNSATTVQVNGNVQNQTGIINVATTTAADLYITGSLTNNATINGYGNIHVNGDWINNSVFNAFTGTVSLEGAAQNLSGSVTTSFYNLTLLGSGIKTQTIDEIVTGTLDLNDRELATDVYTMFVNNTSTTAIQLTTGFVSSNNGGFLSRNTASTSTYLFPVGSSTGTPRYRPVELTPANAAANTYVVRMANVDATTETYDRSQAESTICEVNPLFYHQIDRTSGAAAVDLSIFYDQTTDGDWDFLVAWHTAPSTEWYTLTSSTITVGAPFYEAAQTGWNDFSQLPYALVKMNPVVFIGNDTSICSSNPITLDAGAGYDTYTWSTGGSGQTVPAGTTGDYSVTVTLGACSDVDSITVTVIPDPVVDLGPDTSICQGDLLTLDATNPGAVYNWSTTETTPTIDVGVSNTYSVTVTTGGLCTTTDDILVTVLPNADASITSGLTYCSGDPALDLTAVDGGGTWAGTGITNPTNGTFDPGTAGAGTHEIIYTIAGQCGDADTVDIVVTQSADATISPAGPYCTGDPAENLVGADPGGTWVGTGITDPINGTFDPSAAGNGTFTIYYEIAGVCGDTASILISVASSYDATITSGLAYCSGDTPLDLSAVDGGGTWAGTGITNPSNGTFDPGTAGAGTHEIIYTISGSCGDADTVDIVVTQSADATITPAGPYCDSDPAVTLVGADPGGTWSGTGITSPILGTFNPGVAGAGTYLITYGIAGTCGDTATTSITVNAQQDATITPAGPFCENDLATNLSAVDGGGTWTGTGITNGSLGTFDPTTAGAGVHQIIYTISSTCGDTDTIDVTVIQNADATITPAGPFCENDPSINLTGADPGGTWSGTGITDPILGTFDPTSAGAGTYTITYGIAGQCGDTATTLITVNTVADATITPAGPYCANDLPINLTAVDTGGVWSGTGITGPSNGTFDPGTAGAGIHTIIYTISGACGDADTVDIEVIQNADATITPSGPYCILDAPINLTAADTGGVWSGTGITDPNNGTFDPGTAGAGTFTVTYGIAGQCGDTATTVITVDPQADATITPAGPYCDNVAAVTLTAAENGGTWSGTGITNGTNGTFDPATAGSGTHSITYTISGTCGDADTVDIIVWESPDIILSALDETCQDAGDGTVWVDISGGTSPYTILWETSESNDTIYNLTPGYWGVLISDANGCMTGDSIMVYGSTEPCYDPHVYVPNIFSPNSDGSNDILYVRGDGIDFISFAIYDRWGEKMFETSSIDNGWDGTFMGQPVNPGVYVYYLTATFLDGTESVISGNITLVR